MKKPEGFESEKLLVLPEYILAEMTRDALVSSLYVTDIGYFPRARYHHRERPQGTDAAILIYCAEGEGWYSLEDSAEQRISSQSFVLLPPGVPHQYGASAEQPWSIYWVHLKGQDVSGFIQSYQLGAGPLRLSISASTKFMELFDQCYDLLVERAYSLPHHILASQTMRYLLAAVGLAATRSRTAGRKEQHLDKAVSYMSEHIDSMITLRELASHVGLSRQHLIYQFNRETGVPPIEYFIRMKMQKAGHLLDLTDLSIKAIGLSLGVADPYYFSRVFKRVMGCSPSEYRRIPKG